MTTRAGGSDMDILYGHVWYLKDGKFLEAWMGTLKVRTAFQDIPSLLSKIMDRTKGIDYNYIRKLIPYNIN